MARQTNHSSFRYRPTIEVLESRLTPAFGSPSITGTVFNDLDGNSIKDGGEAGIQNVVIKLIRNGKTVETATTDLSGFYFFDEMKFGKYTVRQVQPAGFVRTTANPAAITIGSELQSVPEVNFGNFEKVNISGQVFNDLDGNGVKDGGEPGLAGVVVTLDRNADGTVDATRRTNASGNYTFANLGPGTYRVREKTPAASLQTSADLADIQALSGVDQPGADIGIFRRFKISGTVFIDRDGDTVKEAGDSGRAGVVVLLDRDANGTVERTTLTNSKGKYVFANLEPGTYRVRLLLPPGMIQPTADPADIVGQSGTNAAAVNFGTFRLVSFGGVVFSDLNGNGKREAGEPGLGGAVVQLDIDANGSVDAQVPTAADGSFLFASLGPDTYRIQLQDGSGQTTINPPDFQAVSDKSVFNIIFGIEPP
jgi:hypothetical protein